MNIGQDYLDRVREEIATLESELQEDRLRARIHDASHALGTSEEIGLAAIYRAARRSGLSLSQFLSDLERTLPSPRIHPQSRS